jgi:hypothetical protein
MQGVNDEDEDHRAYDDADEAFDFEEDKQRREEEFGDGSQEEDDED